MTVESQLDRGTIVRVWLPALFDIEEKAERKPKIEPDRASGVIPMIETEAYAAKMIRPFVRSVRNS